MYTAAQICKIFNTDASLLNDSQSIISRLTMDTRKSEQSEETLFFAMVGSLHDGHDYIKNAIETNISEKTI